MRETFGSWVLTVNARRLMYASLAALGLGVVVPGVVSAAVRLGEL
ncbi:MAG: hypothetical protein ABW034_07055 [Steroidobacteraceae bacterium]